MKWWYWGLAIILVLGAVALGYFFWGRDYLYNKQLMAGVEKLVVFQYPDVLKIGDEKLAKVQLRPLVYDRLVKLGNEDYLLFVYDFNNKHFSQMYVKLKKQLVFSGKIWKQGESDLPLKNGDKVRLDFAYVDERFPTSSEILKFSVPTDYDLLGCVCKIPFACHSKERSDKESQILPKNTLKMTLFALLRVTQF